MLGTMDEKPLAGKVALVTGASRGVGKGIALGLGEAGATVYVTGRTFTMSGGLLPGTVDETADAVTKVGGRGVPVVCDHADDAQVSAVFDRIDADNGRIDILVNNVFAIPDGPMFDTPFWEQPIRFWDTMHDVGLRSHYVASVFAAKRMVAQKSGLIVNVSSFGGATYAVNVAYGVGKAGVDRLARDMAHELLPHKVACISLWPGIVKTERLVAMGDKAPFDMTRGESAQFSGRAIVALYTDAKVLDKTGKVLVVAELAREYGFTDVDGSQPASLRTPPRVP
jgi:dehydrogenase/reductase SDR family protein 1